MNIKIKINIPAYQQIRKKAQLPDVPPIVPATAIADTGAQTCTAGLQLLQLIPEHWLIPTSHRLKSVDNNNLPIRGVLFVDITTPRGATTEMLYICDKVSGIYLSQSALKNLGVIKKTFPKTTYVASTESNKDSSPARTSNLAPCGCPLRTACPPRPTKLPFPATPDHRIDFENWIKKYYSSSAFNVCPHQKLQVMQGEEMKISFKPDSTPHAIHKPIPIPHHWKEKVKAQLDADVALDIIEPIPQGVPTRWCSRMVVVAKKDGSPRRTVDLQALNKATLRETHHTPTPFNIVSTIPNGMKKTILDAWNGYHSVPLSPDSREATTFITEWGRYRYKRAPQGFHGSNDGYTKRFDDITLDFPRTVRCIDDSLLYNTDVSTSFWHTISYIELCAENGIVFNPEKFVFAEDTVEFAGFDITLTGFKPPQRIIKAIQGFQTPRNITDVRSWFGLVAQVSYAFSQAPVMSPFRELLSKKSPFYWDGTLQSIFEESKVEIIKSIKDGVRSFSTNRTTCLGTDWSKTGVGFTLSQKHCQCPGKDPLCGANHWRVVYAGSRFTTDAESRYAPIEGEALALLYGLECCRMFVLGCPDLLIAVDHKPLVPIFNQRELDKIRNTRIQKIRERTLPYNFHVIAIPGIKNVGPNTASRIPPTDTSEIGYIEDSVIAATNVEHSTIASIKLSSIYEHINQDNQYKELLVLIERGFPEKKELTPKTLQEFWPLRHELYTIRKVVFIAGKPLIPKTLRKDILRELHLGHHGISMMKSNARQRFFWPHMNADINTTRINCQHCNRIAPSQPKGVFHSTEDPEYPFQHVVSDFFHMAGHTFIIYADRFSGWTEVAKMEKTNASATCNVIRKYFTFGVPEGISSDGGPPFNSHEYATFLKNWNIEPRLSSAYYAQSNGRAEAAVKMAKRILTTNINESGSLDTDAVIKALLLHRNTPSPDIGVSPSELLFGRTINDHLPNPVRFRQEWSELADARERAFNKRRSQAAKQLDIGRSQTREPPPLSIGDSVAIQNQTGLHHLRWDRTGTISEVLPHWQYRVLVDGSRRSTLRNRRFLRKIAPQSRAMEDEEGQHEQHNSIILNSHAKPTANEIVQPQPTEVKEVEKRVDHPTPIQNNDQPTAPRRSTRVRRIPSKFDDFIME